MGFLAIVNAYTMRICLNVAITEMVVKTVQNESDSTNPDVCYVAGETEENIGGGTFEWSEELQGFILGSFFIGYIITHVP